MLSRIHPSGLFRWSLLGVLLFALASPACGPKEGSCSKNSDCKKITQACDPDTTTCTEIRCKKDEDCRNNWFCNKEKRACQKEDPVECRADSDCQSDQKCDSNKCVIKPECEKNTDCTSDKQCEKNKCITRTCKDDIDCGDNTKYECSQGKCSERKIECNKDTDCKDSQKPLCKKNKCVEKTGCSSNADCTEANKTLCLAGKCVADTGAKEGESCETGKTSCKTGTICYITDKTSTKGTCRTPCSVLTPKCKDKKLCKPTTTKDGVCLDKNNGKTAGEECDDTKNQCEVNLLCKNWKNKKICVTPCDPSNSSCAPEDECYEVVKKQFACVSKRDPCGPGRPCMDGFTCIGGLCDPPPSCEGIKCKDGQVCQNGVCREKRCPKEKTCASSMACNQQTGKCVSSAGDPPCKPCAAQGPQCPKSTDQCISGLGNGTESFCFDSCATTGTCSDSVNFSCQTINITRNGLTCTKDADCRGGGFKCLNGKCNLNAKLCIPKIGTCRNKCQGVSCSGNSICDPKTGTCFAPGKKLCDACTVNGECGGKDDLCVRFPNKSTYCAQDCRNKSCPNGYKCFTLQNGALKQCAPANLSCPP